MKRFKLCQFDGRIALQTNIVCGKGRFVSNCAALPGASASFRDFGVLAVQANTVTGECQDLLNPSGVSFNMSGLPMGFWQKPIYPHTSPSPPPPTHLLMDVYTSVTPSKTGLVVTDASLL